MPCLDEDAGHGTEGDLALVELEAVEVGALATLLLFAEGGADLVELGDYLRVIRGEGREAREGARSIILTIVLDEPTRGLGKKAMRSGDGRSEVRGVPREAKTCPQRE